MQRDLRMGKGSADEERSEALCGLREQLCRQGRAKLACWGTEPRLVCTRSEEEWERPGCMVGAWKDFRFGADGKSQEGFKHGNSIDSVWGWKMDGRSKSRIRDSY